MGPVLTWTTERMLGHMKALLDIPGARLAFGGRPLEGHTIPEVASNFYIKSWYELSMMLVKRHITQWAK